MFSKERASFQGGMHGSGPAVWQEVGYSEKAVALHVGKQAVTRRAHDSISFPGEVCFGTLVNGTNMAGPALFFRSFLAIFPPLLAVVWEALSEFRAGTVYPSIDRLVGESKLIGYNLRRSKRVEARDNGLQ